MSKTIVEKIIAKHCGKDEVSPGEFVMANVDFAFGNDITCPLAIKELEKSGIKEVFDKERVGIIPDHFAPNKDLKSAEQCKVLRDFAKEKGIKYYFEIGQMGIEHALLPEQGLVLPGEVIVGSDSHTCSHGAVGAFATGMGSTDIACAMAIGKVWLKVPESMKFVYTGKLAKWVTAKDLILHTIGDIGVDGALYRAMEFTGKVIEDMDMDGRFTICNMAIEAGGKTGIINPDKKMLSYVKKRKKRDFEAVSSDKDASYVDVREYKVSDMEPQVALPYLPSNVKPISQVGDIPIDQVVIGSCTNGRIEDLRLAAKLFKGKKVHDYVRALVFPATQQIYAQAIEEGLISILIESGVSVSTPTCGPCLGGHMGVLAEGERAVATTNRNFVGRMGHPKSEVYLSGVPVAVASAVMGRIVSPEEI